MMPLREVAKMRPDGLFDQKVNIKLKVSCKKTTMATETTKSLLVRGREPRTGIVHIRGEDPGTLILYVSSDIGAQKGLSNPMRLHEPYFRFDPD